MTHSKMTVNQVSVPDQQTIGDTVFPLVWKCESENVTLDETVAWIREHRAELDQQAAKNGAVLFRGFPLAEPEDFDRFIAAFEFENFPYEQSLSQRGASELYATRILGERGAVGGANLSSSRDGSDAGVPQQAVFLLPDPSRRRWGDADLSIRRVIRTDDAAMSAVRDGLRAQGTSIHQRHAGRRRCSFRTRTQLAEHVPIAIT